jgi:hypothetical protein
MATIASSEDVTQSNVSKLLGEDYGNAATVGNVLAGFKETGIWPVDRHVFTGREFAPSKALIGPEYPDEEEDVTEDDTETFTVKKTDAIVHNAFVPTVPLENTSPLP